MSLLSAVGNDESDRRLAISTLRELCAYRRDLLEARALARDLAPLDATANDDDLRNVNAAILDTRLALAVARPAGLVYAEPEPDLLAFYAALEADPLIGLPKMAEVDQAVPFREATIQRNWALAWGLLDLATGAGLLTGPQRTAVNGHWAASHLPQVG